MDNRHRPGPQRKRGFGGQVTVLAGSTALAQALAILASPILTRLFSPSTFGTYNLFTAAVTIIVVVSSLRYELAIPIVRSRAAATHVMALAISVLLLVTLATAGAALVFRSELTATFKIDSEIFFWLLPIAIATAGFQQIWSNWAVREQNFGVIAGGRIAQSVAAVGTQLTLGHSRISTGLIVGQTFGYVIGSTVLGIRAIPQSASHWKRVSRRRLRIFAARYRRFPLYSTWSGFATSAGTYAPVILMTAAFGPAVAGLYALTTRVLQMPLVVIGSALSQVFFSRVAAESSAAGRAATTAVVFEKLMRIGTAPLLFLAAVAPDVFAFVFGSEWREAGQYAAWLAPLSLLVFVASPLTVLPSVFEKQRTEMTFQSVLFAVRIGSLMVGVALGSPMWAIALFSLASCVWWLAYIGWNLQVAQVPVRGMAFSSVKEFGLGAAAAAPAILGAALADALPLGVSLALIVLSAALCLGCVASAVPFRRR